MNVYVRLFDYGTEPFWYISDAVKIYGGSHYLHKDGKWYDNTGWSNCHPYEAGGVFVTCQEAEDCAKKYGYSFPVVQGKQ